MTDRSRPRLAQEAQSARLTAGIAAHGILPEMNDDRIIRQRIVGHSVSEIAKARRKTVSEANEAIDRWADSRITDSMSCRRSFARARSRATYGVAPWSRRSSSVAAGCRIVYAADGGLADR
jgi:hypothetical protein